ncbi:MAG: methyltransferase [Buchnera aphidicola (Nurudea yanoniella)]
MYLDTFKQLIIHTQDFTNWIYFKKNTSHTIKFSLLEEKEKIYNSDAILYFWPNSKYEAIFHLKHIFSQLNKEKNFFLVGKKNSGINTAKNLLKKWVILKKIDSAKHCLLFYGKIISKPNFQLDQFIHNINWNQIKIQTIPGIFSYKKIDLGSKLLISTFEKSITGDILDIGCGSGILSVSLAQYSKKNKFFLIDTNMAALKSSELTLKCNNVKGKIFPSNVYSHICKKFDFIMSNPPIHKNSKINLNYVSEIIRKSEKYLKSKGEIRIVVSSNIFCDKYFKDTKLKYKILKEKNNFRVYQGKKY